MRITHVSKSQDGMATKFMQETADRHTIETLYVDYPNKHIICYSIQIGCNCGCKFCYTGLNHKLVRNLGMREIVEQCETVMMEMNIDRKPSKPILFSAMGVGEPLANYENYLGSLFWLHLKYPGSKFALATCGISIASIMDLGVDCKIKEIDLKLTASLHFANRERHELMMPNAIDPSALIFACKQFAAESGKPVEYNITLIDGVNDSELDAYSVVSLFDKLGVKPYIKINRFNKIPGEDLEPSKHVEEFIKILRVADFDVEYYETNGADIGGACGQMTAM